LVVQPPPRIEQPVARDRAIHLLEESRIAIPLRDHHLHFESRQDMDYEVKGRRDLVGQMFVRRARRGTTMRASSMVGSVAVRQLIVMI
jgi:hypothetical protein